MVCCVCRERPANPFREDGICDECGWFWDYWNGLTAEQREVEWWSPVPFVFRGVK